MANEEEFRKVGRRREEMTTVLILLEKLLSNLQINLLLISLIITLIGQNTRKRKRWSIEDPTRMLDSIPAHVKQLDRLVRLTDWSCVDNLRMDRNTFGRLCRILRDRAGLIDQKFVTVEEQVAMFLCVLSHHKKTRIVGYDFMRSSHTVSRYIHIVLRGVLMLHNLFLVKTSPIDDSCNDRRWSWFKGCLGWEGSAGDSRILRDAISRPLGLKVPKGCYYLCDNAYPNAEGFVTPFKGVHYHLKEWGPSTQAPQMPEELFNLRHSKARNVIERSFAVLKMRWGILCFASFYPIEVQTGLIIACFLLHNFIRDQMAVDPVEEELGDHNDDGDETDQEQALVDHINSVEPSAGWNKKRDDLATAMWAERHNV
ncbi:uncharacterized protein LOC121764282 [Salvia splendens]|uniref:uncharacterized protein LOC121764282 n=1 Tax=Salvia splendens TaxID=180675 RepID=UPI001C258CBD|nr:uncharacterized protein LOC121764282 [Salvia splendens]